MPFLLGGHGPDLFHRPSRRTESCVELFTWPTFACASSTKRPSVLVTWKTSVSPVSGNLILRKFYPRILRRTISVTIFGFALPWLAFMA